MATASVFNRVLQIGRINPRKNLSRIEGFGTFSSATRHRYFCVNEASQVAKSGARPLFLFDTFAVVRRLEADGVPTKQAEAITGVLTNVLNDSLEHVTKSYVSKSDLQKSEMTQDGNFSLFKSEVQTTQEHHFSLLQHETEKLRNDLEKMRSESVHEIDKVIAGQRLDMNLEKGRIRDQLANQISETANLTYKLDREIHALRIQMEAAKFDVIKNCIGTVVSVSAVCAAGIRLFM